MATLRNLQREFIDYLLDDHCSDIVTRVESTQGRSAEKRVALYADAYHLRLKEALLTDYERLHGYLGDELFEQVMIAYIKDYPSHYTSLRDYGQHMVRLLEGMAVFAAHPEVIELARIEQAFAHSFDARDAEPVTLEQLFELAPEAWPELTFQFHAAVQLLPLRYNSFPIWRALSEEQTPPEKSLSPTTWLIWRQDLITRFRALDDAELAALNVAMRNGTFAEICSALLEHFDEQDVPLKAVSYIKQWIEDQMLIRLGQGSSN